jgi:CPA1 family monovalent cation:H+ antiporter
LAPFSSLPSRIDAAGTALIIVVIGIAASFLPGFDAPELDSHILLTVVLPPLLYSAALDFSFPTFLRNIRPILVLASGSSW